MRVLAGLPLLPGPSLHRQRPRVMRLTVTISNVGLADGFGSVEETLPAGYSYVVGSATSTTVPMRLSRLRFLARLSPSPWWRWTRSCTRSLSARTLGMVSILSPAFSKKLSGQRTAIASDDSVTVGAGTTTPPPDTTTPPIGSVSRLLPAGSVSPDDELAVTINSVGLGAAGGIGDVIETLPAGFSYVDGFCYAVSEGGAGAVIKC